VLNGLDKTPCIIVFILHEEDVTWYHGMTFFGGVFFFKAKEAPFPIWAMCFYFVFVGTLGANESMYLFFWIKYYFGEGHEVLVVD
jgi:hypothetical protein